MKSGPTRGWSLALALGAFGCVTSQGASPQPAAPAAAPSAMASAPAAASPAVDQGPPLEPASYRA